MKKRILSLAMAACLALSMMLTLSACGKKNLEEYFNTDTMQKLVTSSVEQYESQGMELKMYAEGDELHYDLTLTTIETTAPCMPRPWRQDWPKPPRPSWTPPRTCRSPFPMRPSWWSSPILTPPAWSWPPSPSPLRTEPGTHRGSCTGAAPFFAPKRGADNRIRRKMQ